ncbi:hypothetical protein GO988_14760 [Hymenobacter sp. HMF4947]|uniref:DUF308 domain-containing protein n=1 Tax=Hymenobacter ginkgonis TaxID=2682976 RepID=A0A7K1TGV5_9BACT|nr:DUF308 domain-containing protein [Hymenobacter ginkgonis]MVN77593.1 hypothetical protein [Hymenobacter ginkgonis]
MAPSTATFSQPANTVRDLRLLYFVRAAFAFVWAGLLAAKLPALTPLLLLLYPTWDVVATFADLRASRRSSLAANGSRYLNIVIGLVTTVAVAVALQQSTAAVLLVFGVWAILTGLIQLVLAWRRHRGVGGQWPMMLSGAQSAVAGCLFIAHAHSPEMGLNTLWRYAAFGGFYFLLAAWRLRSSALATSSDSVA